VVPTERLVDLIWGDEAPRTAVHSIQIYVSDLRKALGSNRAGIVTRPPGYLLQVEPAAVDMFRFEQMVEKGSS
jgi:DNA-binding SARP family transcriptional activator